MLYVQAKYCKHFVIAFLSTHDANALITCNIDSV